MPPNNMMNNFVPTPHVAPVMMEEPMEKKRKTVIIKTLCIFSDISNWLGNVFKAQYHVFTL